MRRVSRVRRRFSIGNDVRPSCESPAPRLASFFVCWCVRATLVTRRRRRGRAHWGILSNIPFSPGLKSEPIAPGLLQIDGARMPRECLPGEGRTYHPRRSRFGVAVVAVLVASVVVFRGAPPRRPQARAMLFMQAPQAAAGNRPTNNQPALLCRDPPGARPKYKSRVDSHCLLAGGGGGGWSVARQRGAGGAVERSFAGIFLCKVCCSEPLPPAEPRGCRAAGLATGRGLADAAGGAAAKSGALLRALVGRTTKIISRSSTATGPGSPRASGATCSRASGAGAGAAMAA